MRKIFKGQTLIINTNVKMTKELYTFAEGDKVRVALKKFDSADDNVLYREINATAGETEVQAIFSNTETQEKLTVGEKYIVQADLLNSDGVFPMLLEELEVVGQAIIPSSK